MPDPLPPDQQPPDQQPQAHPPQAGLPQADPQHAGPRSPAHLDDRQLAEFRGLLVDLRSERLAEHDRIDSSLAEVRHARSDGTADDEHDPDGPTLSVEWSRLAGLERESGAKSAAVEAALARIDDGTFGACLRCGRSVGLDRLHARPTAEHCIECARMLDARR